MNKLCPYTETSFNPQPLARHKKETTNNLSCTNEKSQKQCLFNVTRLNQGSEQHQTFPKSLIQFGVRYNTAMLGIGHTASLKSMHQKVFLKHPLRV